MNVEKYKQVKDIEIIARILSGEGALYEVIIRRYNPYLFKIGRSYGFSQHDVEDLMQDSFINAYTGLSKFGNRSSLKTWLVKIMLNQCYHKKQKASFRKEVASDFQELKNITPMFTQNNTQTGNLIMNNELKHILEKALLKISEDFRTVFTLRELNGMNVKETSEALEISEANVKVRLNRAKSMLRDEIRKMYSPEEIFEFNLIYCNRVVEKVMQHLDRERKESKGLRYRLGWKRHLTAGLQGWRQVLTGKISS